MNYIFCAAYRELFFSLFLKNRGKEITLITYVDDIKKFCDDANINCIFFSLPDIGLKTFTRIKKIKEILDDLINRIDFQKNDCYYILQNAVAFDGFYLAKELAKKGKVIYRKPDIQFDKYKFKFKYLAEKDPRIYLLSRTFIRILFKISLGIDLVFYETTKVPRIGIDEKFLKQHNIETMDWNYDINDVIFEVVNKSTTKFKEYDNMIIDGGTIEGRIEYDSARKAFDFLSKIPLQYTIKMHPTTKNHRNMYGGIFKDLIELPSYIPVELYFKSIRKNVIALCSASLVMAAKIKHLKAISLLELVDWYHESYKDEWKKELEKASNNKIIFPNSYKELEEILKK